MCVCFYICCVFVSFCTQPFTAFLERANFKTKVKIETSFVPLFQVMTSAQRDSFVEKTLSVKTGILKLSVNARAAMPPSTGILLTVKVGPYFTQLRLSRGS